MNTATEARSPSSTAARQVLVRAPGEGERIWFLDNLHVVKATGRDGARFGLLEQSLPEGSTTPFHRHHDEDESFYVLEGTLTLFLEGDRTVRASPGTFACIPAGVAHGFRTTSAVKMLVLADPAGFPELVRAYGVPAPRPELPPAAPPDVPRLVATAAKHGIEILGPLPE